MEPILTIQNLKKIYHTRDAETLAVEDFSYSMNQGEFVSIVGPSGCGKSTILSILCGLDTLSSGKIKKKKDLIEVNASPALDYSTKITKEAVQKMVKDLITLIVDYNNGRDFKVDKNGEGHPNKFIQIFNENRDRIKIPENVPNKSMFY